MSGRAVVQGTEPALVDLDDAPEVFSEALEWMASRGVFTGTGCDESRLCPNEAIPRWEAAVWLVRVVDDDDEPDAVSKSRFDDVDAATWWAAHVERLAELEITVGCTQHTLRFCPHDTVTRAQMASFLVRAFELAPAEPAGFTDIAGSVHEADINALHAAAITVGCRTEPLQYCPLRPTTRAHMATFLHRALQPDNQ